MLFVLFLYLIPVYILVSIARFICHKRKGKFRAYLREKYNRDDKFAIFGFFHPYCNAGGGGERVLWMAIDAVQKEYARHAVCVVYTGDTEFSEESIRKKTLKTFNFELSQPVEIVYLRQRWLVEDKYYPRLTLLFQALGTVVLSLEALWRCVPDVFIDAMGFAFSYPTFRLLGRCIVACYTHYPFISTDMLDRVASRAEDFNNASAIARSPVLSAAKWGYYWLLAKVYGLAGRCSHLAMTNSSWTRAHIVALWGSEEKTVIVYPPCGDGRGEAEAAEAEREKTIVSISQFRPEKNHQLQLEALALFRKNCPAAADFRLIMIGGCRNEDDERRVEALRSKAEELGIAEFVEFKVNAPFHEWLQIQKSAMIGLHTMRDEHFGIGVVECMAAGMIMLAHNSAGPKMDIVDKGCGFLATTVEEYADCLDRIVNMTRQERAEMVRRAREKAKQFTDATFVQRFTNQLSTVLEERPQLFS